MLETFGTAGAIESHDFSGKTDPQIVRELLTDAGLEDAAVDAGLAGLWDRYIGELEARIRDNPMRLLPGVADLIEALDAEPDVALGLVTGNIIRGARVKLGSVGLAGFFAIGGYGSDHEIRERLPAIALERAFETWGVRFPAASTVVVGDTHRDVEMRKARGYENGRCGDRADSARAARDHRSRRGFRRFFRRRLGDRGSPALILH